MLVIRREHNEGVVIGTSEHSPEVEVSIVAIRENNVRLGISLPREWIVRRKETFLAIKEELNRNEKIEVTMQVPAPMMTEIIAGLVEKGISFSACIVPNNIFHGDPVWVLTLR